MATAAAAPAKRWAREYETIYILRPDVDEARAEKIVDRVRDVIKRLDGTLTKLDNWGKRRLAYPIRKNTRGIFVYLKFVGFGDLVAELERNLRLLDEVVRFQTVLLREDIDPATVEVDPEEVKYLHVEGEDEPVDAEEERARSLGMAPAIRREEPMERAVAAAEAEAFPGVEPEPEPKAEAEPEAGAAAEAEPEAEAGAAAEAEPEAESAPPSEDVPDEESADEESEDKEREEG